MYYDGTLPKKRENRPNKPVSERFYDVSVYTN